ncbi:hypothetical protein [Chitinimonas koreensis]|uniref:hypothetical protein n=1 Tax=Chitinimonas koreensis TaxID=356302 RepID=UPI0012FCECF9|nr:hypothetical protein [Chitinimonas koreensis]QNM97724.1 hypothetical protein H9L41_05370 [Chitinimonas koreensis]
MTVEQSFYTPESLFVPSPDAPPGLHIDALECALARAQAVLLLLSQQYDGGSVDHLGGETLSYVVDDIRGNLKLAQKIIETAFEHSGRLG